MAAVLLSAAFAAAAALAAADTPSASPSPTPVAHAGRPRTKVSPSPVASGVPEPAPGKKSGHVYSNEDLPKEPSPIAAPAPGQGRGAVTVLPGGAAPIAVASPEPVPHDQTEDFWRHRGDLARDAVESVEHRIAELQSRIEALRNDRGMTNVMDPNREQNRQAQMNQAEADLARANEDLSRAREAIANLEDEARRKSIPPGWLRPR